MTTMATNQVAFGRAMRDEFLFEDGWTNLNHGSYGTYPKSVCQVLLDYQLAQESRPDEFIRYKSAAPLAQARKAVADLVRAPLESITFVQNATTGTNTVLRNLEYTQGDVILTCETIYGACDRTVQYICETTAADTVHYVFKEPMTESDLIDGFREKIRQVHAESDGKRRVKVAIFDTIASMPGVRWPWEQLVQVCKEEGVFSCVDGAHGIGAIDLNLGETDPDFFVSNCHKWLYVPKSCAMFYVPVRNQHLIRSTVPTSFGLISKDSTKQGPPVPRPTLGDSAFIANFSYYGTLDNSAIYCVPEAIRFRREVCGGEEAIREYCQRLAWEGAEIIAETLGTRLLEVPLKDSPMANVLLPLEFDGEGKLICDAPEKSGLTSTAQVWNWIGRAMTERYDTFMANAAYRGSMWLRVSGQIYLEREDFVKAGEMLKTLCEEIRAGAVASG